MNDTEARKTNPLGWTALTVILVAGLVAIVDCAFSSRNLTVRAGSMV